jgi:hypothetical protein
VTRGQLQGTEFDSSRQLRVSGTAAETRPRNSPTRLDLNTARGTDGDRKKPVSLRLGIGWLERRLQNEKPRRIRPRPLGKRFDSGHESRVAGPAADNQHPVHD